jgi:membrane-associated phospholipid phosphatase
MRVVLLVVLLLGAAATTAHAEPWYKGRYGTNRVLHVSIALGGEAVYIATTPFEDSWMADTCRWCDPTALDVAARNGLRWHDHDLANTLSNLDAYAVTPAFAAGLVLAGTLSDFQLTTVIDDFIPILESTVIARFATRTLKLAVGRQRPDAHFTGIATAEENVSFPSGHTSGAMSAAVSAAVVARMRGYRSEPYLWIGGTLLAATAGYLRIAADRHYLTDVLGGAAIGAGAGLTVPYLMKRDVSVVPTRDGIAVVGAW